MLKVRLNKELNDGIDNFYNSIIICLDKDSKEIVHFIKHDEFIIEKDQILPEISHVQAEHIAKDYYKELGMESGIDSSKLSIISIELIPDTYLANKPKLYDDYYYLGYEVKFKDGNIVNVDASTAKAISIDYIETVDTDQSYTRIEGKDRVETSIAASKANYPDGSECLVLVDGYRDYDSLPAAYIAIEEERPILLVGKGGLDKNIKEEISRLDPDKIFLINDSSFLTNKDMDELKNLADLEILDQESDLDLAYDLWESYNKKANKSLIVIGNSTADSLSALNYLAKGGYDLVLSDGKSINQAYSLSEDKLIVRGPNTISLDLDGGKNVSGPNRYATSLAIGKSISDNPQRLVLVSGAKYDDILASIAFAGDGPIILLVSDNPGKETLDYISKAKEVIVIGGENTIRANFLD